MMPSDSTLVNTQAALLWSAAIWLAVPLMLAVRRHLHESFRSARHRDDRALDLGFWLWDALALSPLLGLLLLGLFQVWPHWIGEPPGEREGACAFLIQAGFAVWLGDGLASLRHRIEHTRFFWRWHAWHHQVDATDWLGTHRHHPFSRILGFVLEALVLLLLMRILFGYVHWPAIVGSLALRRAWAIWLHSGSTWGMQGSIGRFVVLPAQHRMHHSGAPIYAGLFHHWDAVWATLVRLPGTLRGTIQRGSAPRVVWETQGPRLSAAAFPARAVPTQPGCRRTCEAPRSLRVLRAVAARPTEARRVQTPGAFRH